MLVSNVEFLSVALSSSILSSCVFVFVLSESNDDSCESLVSSPFEICTTAGYNYTIPFPKRLDESLRRRSGQFLTSVIKTYYTDCSTYSLTATLECAFTVPKCGSNGKRIYPCRRVCGEFLKQCMNSTDTYREIHMNFLLSLCVGLPDETPTGDNCFEPPNFTTNDSVPNPLDRGCQKLIFPACSKLGIYTHTLFSESVQKTFYELFYNKTYNQDDLEQGFPQETENEIAKYPKCRKNIEKLLCGELFPPCFPEEPKALLKTLCRSVCNEIVADCPSFFSNRFLDAEYCGLMAEGETSHGFCNKKEWPLPFFWLDYIDPTTAPTKKPGKRGPKTWVIAVAVLLPLLFAGLALAGLIWWRWRSKASGMGYTKQQDEPSG